MVRVVASPTAELIIATTTCQMIGNSVPNQDVCHRNHQLHFQRRLLKPALVTTCVDRLGCRSSQLQVDGSGRGGAEVQFVDTSDVIQLIGSQRDICIEKITIIAIAPIQVIVTLIALKGIVAIVSSKLRRYPLLQITYSQDHCR